MDVLVAGGAIGRGGGVVAVEVVAADVAVAAAAAAAVVVVAVVAAAAGAGAAAVAAAAAVVVVVDDVGVAAFVDGAKKGCNEAGWGDETPLGSVEVGGVGVDGPTTEIGEHSHMGMSADHGRSRKMRRRSGVVAGQGAWMVACRCAREIGRAEFDGVVVADGSMRAVDSSFGRLDVVAKIADWFSPCLTAGVGTEQALGFGQFLGAMRHAPGSRARS